MLYIDNTYISSLEELKTIIESHAKDKLGQKQDAFRTELIEAFEDKTATGLLSFVESLPTDEAKDYAKHLAEIEPQWESLSASEQYNALVSFFKIAPSDADVMKYIEILKSDIQEEDNGIKVSIDVKVITPVNENVQFKINLNNGNNILVSKMTNKQSLAVSPNQILHFAEQITQDEWADMVEISINQRVIEKCHMGKNLSFSVDGVEFNMIRVRGGDFMMDGSKFKEEMHKVSLTTFYIAETQVTQKLWEKITGEKITDLMKKAEAYYVKGENPNNPVYFVNYNDCEKFIKKLNNKLKNQLKNGLCFDFPTEAQWEYSARGGCHHSDYIYSGSNFEDEVAWHFENSNKSTHPVGQKKANKLGIYDMCGNVWEWCKDVYRENNLCETIMNPIIKGGQWENHVVRGGSWYNSSSCCTVYYRYYFHPTKRENNVGLRLALCRKE